MRQGFIILESPEYYEINTEEQEQEQEGKKCIRNSFGKHTDVAKALHEDDKAHAWMMWQVLQNAKGPMRKENDMNIELHRSHKKIDEGKITESKFRSPIFIP